ncbi:MAG: ATP-dependent metallopeptidase FtsH/Yme1/Tma family protein, partial [Paramuribaculum sp.]|nr:ATP-dependent metallopeptidase FtsH/Yme1/Tma family protein [Paramuribaculum sp.]
MDNKPSNPKKGIRFSMYWMYAIVVGFLLFILWIDEGSMTKDVDMTQFEQYVKTGGVSKIVIFTNKNEAEGYL